MLNVGYALIYHQPADPVLEGLDDDEEDVDWVGQSVTLIMRPGSCTSFSVEQPKIEWTTMGGGTQRGIQTTSVGLLDIHSITNSSMNDDGDPIQPDDENFEEDMNCFLTITTKEGAVHILEAISSNASQRLVSGIRNMTARFTNEMVRGDKHVLLEFFNSPPSRGQPLTQDQVLARLSHQFLDDL